MNNLSTNLSELAKAALSGFAKTTSKYAETARKSMKVLANKALRNIGKSK